jgi:hypothetical protein
MSASTWLARARDRVDFYRPTEESAPGKWIGIDLSSESHTRRVRKLLPLLVIALIAALGVSALRIDLIRTRYAMASALAEEKALIAEQRRLIIRRRQLRDPVELAVQARARGFRPVAGILSLPEPSIPGSASLETASNLPAVASGPPPPSSQAGNDWQ